MLCPVDFLVRVVLNAVGLAVAVFLIDGIVVDTDNTAAKIGTYLLVGLVVGVVNAVIRPVAQLLSCPLTLLTLGLFALVVNALLFWASATVVDTAGIPFHVDGFWAAFWGAIVVSIVSWLLSLIVRRD